MNKFFSIYSLSVFPLLYFPLKGLGFRWINVFWLSRTKQVFPDSSYGCVWDRMEAWIEAPFSFFFPFLGIRNGIVVLARQSIYSLWLLKEWFRGNHHHGFYFHARCVRNDVEDTSLLLLDSFPYFSLSYSLIHLLCGG